MKSFGDVILAEMDRLDKEHKALMARFEGGEQTEEVALAILENVQSVLALSLMVMDLNEMNKKLNEVMKNEGRKAQA